jgi:hypothetical protein
MRPERARELYTDYAEGTLDLALRLAMDQHFAADADARADYTEFERVLSLLGTLEREPVEVPPGFRAKVLERVSVEQSQRAAAPGLTGWFQNWGRRRVVAGSVAALAACAVVGVVFAPHNSTVGGPPNQASLGPSFPLPVSLETTLAGVTTSPQDASGNHYDFLLHLPADVPSATVNAYLLSNNDQITEPDKLAQATPALSPPQTLSNDESMTIPVTLLHPTPGGTLAMLVQWGPANGQIGGQQVVFTPVLPTAAPTPQALPANSNIYDALQAVAAQDDVTVIADATNAPTQAVSLPSGTPSGPGHALADLKTLAGEVGATIQNVPGGAYLISLSSPQTGG